MRREHAASYQDLRRVDELVARLHTVRLGAPPVLAEVVPELGTLLHADKTCAYGLTAGRDSLGLEFAFAAGVPKPAAREALTELVGESPHGWAGILYDPRSPEPKQRNRVRLHLVGSGTAAEVRRYNETSRSATASRVYRRLGIADHDQIRVLVCDGPALLAWLGAFRPEPFTNREGAILARLTPAVRQALLLERSLAVAPIAFGAMNAALEAVGGPAFLVRQPSAIVHANSAGRMLLDSNRTQVLEEVRNALAGDHSSMDVTPIECAGMPAHYLAIRRGPDEGQQFRLRRFTARYDLTERQMEVLQYVVKGHANKSIAAALHCSNKTIELHVTNLLARVQVASRAELIARFWVESR